MDLTLTAAQKDLIQKFIDAQPVKAVNYFDVNTKMISYSSLIRGKKIKEIKGDEELARACLITKLANEYGYDLERLEIEHEYSAGRPHTNTSIIDLIVRDSNGNAFLFIELKSPYAYANEDRETLIEQQLFKVAAQEKAERRKVKYLMLYTVSVTDSDINDECIIIDYEKYPTFKDWEASKEYSNTIPTKYGKSRKTPYVKGSPHDLQTNLTHELLNSLRAELHNVLWGGGGTDDNDVFSSLTNLILAKIQDEDEKGLGDIYDFQSLSFVDDTESYETLEQLFERINLLYRRALKEKLNVTDQEEIEKSYVVDTKKFSLEKVKYTVQTLEGYSFVDGKNSVSKKDILGDFFEGIIRDGFKQSKGQFFTHINIVRFMLWGLQADRLALSRINKHRKIPYMIDPSAGSGTFLIEYMKFITQNMKYRFRDHLHSSRAVENKFSEWFLPNQKENKWAGEYIYGCELNFNLGTAAKVNMILHGDGATNIFVGAQRGDGLLPFSKYVNSYAHNALNREFDDQNYNRNINAQFDLILTNPPFSVDLDNDTKKTIQKSFIFGDKKNSENLFVERWYQLLREKGRLAAILPESVFDTTENKYIRLFLYKYFHIKAVVSLPQLTFEPYTSTKTSILFAQKKTAKEISSWNTLWSQASKEYSALKTRTENLIAVYDGQKQKENLPSIRDMDEEQERETLQKMLKNHITKRDAPLSAQALIEKYRSELKELCTYDKDTAESFGYVNTWWVFEQVASQLNYNVFMAEADHVGYKRTKRGEKEMPNELFTLEYAPLSLDTAAVSADYQKRLSDLQDAIAKETARTARESKADKLDQIKERIAAYTHMKTDLERELKEVENFMAVYYDNDTLREEFLERTDEILINEFKNGRLQQYASSAIALHNKAHLTILDYMRDIHWE